MVKAAVWITVRGSLGGCNYLSF